VARKVTLKSVQFAQAKTCRDNVEKEPQDPKVTRHAPEPVNIKALEEFRR
jgi:hypothetical protein